MKKRSSAREPASTEKKPKIGGTFRGTGINWKQVESRVGRKSQPRGECSAAVAAQLKQIREDSGVSLTQLADRIGVSPAKLIKFEDRHHPITLEIVAAMAGELGYELTLKKQSSK